MFWSAAARTGLSWRLTDWSLAGREAAVPGCALEVGLVEAEPQQYPSGLTSLPKLVIVPELREDEKNKFKL